ncbi:MAG: porphobilinogen synthase [Elusimicrobia bacterium]|nr:porphobilinogen synthase [Elusimicrobiota bacterium]
MAYPAVRLRRWRKSPTLRTLIRETKVSLNNLVLPLFVRPGKNIRNPISSMPGQFQFSLDQLLLEIKEAHQLGIKAILVFGIPFKKDEFGKEAYASHGIIQNSIHAIKDKFPDLSVIADCCLCEYTSHGHCGVIHKKKDSFVVDNDATLKLLAKIAVSQARAGADLIAPSGMIDGMVKTIRSALDQNGFSDRLILSYSAKYASNFYGPFRDAAEGKPRFGDRKSYQMDFSNWNEALREVAQDLEEGADMVMVKPALCYLDVVHKIKEKFNAPVAAYNVSGEYAMVKAASKNNWLDEKQIILEILTSMKRAGADLIITYHAKEIANSL